MKLTLIALAIVIAVASCSTEKKNTEAPDTRKMLEDRKSVV